MKIKTINSEQLFTEILEKEREILGKDVTEWIDYSKTSEGYYNTGKMLKTVDDDEKMTITNGNSGGKTEFLTEGVVPAKERPGAN